MISTFFGLGKLSLAKVSIQHKFELSFLVGCGIFIILTSFGYQLGFSLRWVSGFLEALGVFVTAWNIYKRLLWNIYSWRLNLKFKSSSIIIFVASVFLFIPSFVGGIALRVFQGNHWDYLSYEGIAQSISRYSFKTLLAGPGTGLALKDPVTILASSSLHARPNVEILLASIAAPLHLSILDNTYIFFVGLIILLALTMSYFAQHFLAFKFKYFLEVQTSLIALFVLGFWGQYFIDINALSALAAIPFLLALCAVMSIYFESARAELLLILTLFEVTAVLIYPEASAFLIPFFGAQIVVLIWRRRKELNWIFYRRFLLSQVGVLTLLLLSAYKPIDFIVSQIHVASSKASAPWGSYFQAYLGGNNGLTGIHAPDLIRTFPLGILGEYFLAPSHLNLSNLRDVLSLLLTLLTYITLAIVIFRSRREWLKKAEFTIPLSLFLIFLPLVYFKSTLWVAGKGFSYLAPMVFLFIFYLFVIAFQNSHKIQKYVLVAVALVWIVSQAGFGFSRILNSPSGIVHNFPAYPAAQVSTMKSKQDWFLNTEFMDKSCSAIRVKILDPFQTYYVEMKLNEKNLLWWSSLPINSYFGSGSNLGNMQQINAKYLCLIQNLQKSATATYKFKTSVLKG